MKLLANIIIRIAAIMAAAYLIGAVEIDGFWAAFWVMIVLAPVDAILKPILQIISLPITILTLGIFALVVNGLLVLLVAAIVPGFTVGGLWAAILFSIALSLITFFYQKLFGQKVKR
jgi:putative membrane protein